MKKTETVKNRIELRVVAAMGRRNVNGLKPFCVVTPCGVPDFRVYAKTPEAAREAVEQWVHNELEAAEDIEWSDE